jgi:hypothetical protein
MKNIFKIFFVIMIVSALSSESPKAETPQRTLVKEEFSNGAPGKCQIFREWKIDGIRVGCCTDDSSMPLTLCINEFGQDVEEVK